MHAYASCVGRDDIEIELRGIDRHSTPMPDDQRSDAYT